MGLDWCLRDKVIEGKEEQNEFNMRMLNELDDEIGKEWKQYLQDNLPGVIGMKEPDEGASEEEKKVWERGIMKYTGCFPNDLHSAFYEEDTTKRMLDKQKEWRQSADLCVVSPMEALEAPRVGHDKEATDWAIAQWTEGKEGQNSRLLAAYPTVESYLEYAEGLYVSELAKNQDGIGTVSGIAVGAESFRGKCLQFVEDLDQDLIDEAYTDHDPDELMGYGERLLIAALTLSSNDDSELVESAAKWCEFWGSRGFSMVPWY
jgi:hypothetical protein